MKRSGIREDFEWFDGTLKQGLGRNPYGFRYFIILRISEQSRSIAVRSYSKSASVAAPQLMSADSKAQPANEA